MPTDIKVSFIDPLIVPIPSGDMRRLFLYPLERAGLVGGHVIIVPDVHDGSTDIEHVKAMAERALEAILRDEAKIIIATDGLTEAARATLRPDNFKDLSAEERWAVDKRLGILDWDK